MVNKRYFVLGRGVLSRYVRKTRKFFFTICGICNREICGKICGNRPRLHIRVNLTWYILWGDGIAQSLFSKLTSKPGKYMYSLTGSNNFFNLQQQMVCIIVCHVHLTTTIDYPQIWKLDKCGSWKNNYNEYLMLPKMPKYAEKICDMRTLLC